MSKILVTGGAGFIGSNCANILARHGHEIIAFDNLSLGTPKHLDEGVLFVEGDVRDEEALRAVGPVDIVIHLAASSSAPMFETDLEGSVANNIVGHIKVLEYARTHGVQKVLYASTSSIYGNNPLPLKEDQSVVPPNFYAVSKHCQEEFSHVYSQKFGLEIIGFRFMSVYGLHEEHKGSFANLVSQFIWGIEQGKEPVLYGDGSQTRDFVNVKDVVAAFEKAITTEKRYGASVFNVGTTHAISLRELVALIGRIMHVPTQGKCIPNPITQGYIGSQQADLEKITTEFSYIPEVSLEEGIREIVAYREQRKVIPTSLSF